MGIGDWGLGIGDWGLGPIPNPQSPFPNFQNEKYKEKILEKLENKAFNAQDETIVKVCLLPKVPFNVIMSFCIV